MAKLKLLIFDPEPPVFQNNHERFWWLMENPPPDHLSPEAQYQWMADKVGLTLEGLQLLEIEEMGRK